IKFGVGNPVPDEALTESDFKSVFMLFGNFQAPTKLCERLTFRVTNGQLPRQQGWIRALHFPRAPRFAEQLLAIHKAVADSQEEIKRLKSGLNGACVVLLHCPIPRRADILEVGLNQAQRFNLTMPLQFGRKLSQPTRVITTESMINGFRGR